MSDDDKKTLVTNDFNGPAFYVNLIGVSATESDVRMVVGEQLDGRARADFAFRIAWPVIYNLRAMLETQITAREQALAARAAQLEKERSHGTIQVN